MALDANVPASAEVVRAWRTRLLRGEWRTWDLELLHGLVAVVNVATALLASALVVATTKGDGNVHLAVAFVACLVAGLVFVRATVRAGLRATERRTAASVASEARRTLLDAVARGAPIRPGAAAAFVAKSARAAGEYVASAMPARAVALPIPLVVLVLLGVVDPWSAGIAAGVALIAPMFLVVLGRRAAAEAEAGLGRLRSLASRALELLGGAVELRALGALGRGRAELAAATDRAVASTRRSLRLGLRSATVLDVLAGAAVGLVAMTDGFRLLNGTLGLGHAVAAVLLTAEVFGPLRTAGTSFHAAADGRAAIAMLEAATTAARPASVEARTTLPAAARTPPGLVAERAAIAPAPGAPVVAVVTCDVTAGGSLVVRGPSGSGKSTWLRAVSGEPLVVDGALRLGNAPAERLSPRQRSALVAMVDQRPLVVAGTLRENLVLGGRSPDDPAALDDVVERCGLSAVVARAPRGLDEPVGEEGRLLSAGERAQVALARAVLRDPGVLLLDEIAAHLDDRVLASLRARLAGFLSSRTVVEAAHDRSLLVGADELRLGAVTVAAT